MIKQFKYVLLHPLSKLCEMKLVEAQNVELMPKYKSTYKISRIKHNFKAHNFYF